MNIRYRVLVLLMSCLTAVMLQGKTIKPITVAQGQPYTDHIALAKDATDKDIMVKFQFNEDANTLTVSVISYRTLFVFWDDTRYKNAIRRRWIHTDRLPYMASTEEGQRFRLSKQLKKRLPRPVKSYVFKKWMTYDGLQPQEQEIKMVNSYIEQTFDIQNKRNIVMVGLHDLMLLDHVKQRGKNSVYQVSFGQDLDTEYQIVIQRDPCFGLDKETDAAQKALEAVRKSYQLLKKEYGKGVVSSLESQKAFNDLKATLTAQYQHNNDRSTCPVIQDLINRYNLFSDSLSSMKVSIETPVGISEKILGNKDNESNEKVVLSNARLIDNKVARWLSTNDSQERIDIVKECQNIIADTNLTISILPSGKYTETIKIFRQAEQYFKRTCK